MLRSFDYAAQVTLAERPDRMPGHTVWVRVWTSLVSARFLRAYRDTVAEPHLWPTRPGDAALLLETFLLDKVTRELEYELSLRPGWAHVPVRGMLGILDGPRRAEPPA
jgi:maltose alpha-D-glucosyltransferase/alpha-amylase